MIASDRRRCRAVYRAERHAERRRRQIARREGGSLYIDGRLVATGVRVTVDWAQTESTLVAIHKGLGCLVEVEL